MTKQKTILHLSLKKKWFDMILQGIKMEEYREINEYWTARLVDCIEQYKSQESIDGIGYRPRMKDFDIVRFRNGYGRSVPQMDVECKGIKMKSGRPKWGAVPNKEYYAIQLGDVLEVKNLKSELPF